MYITAPPPHHPVVFGALTGSGTCRAECRSRGQMLTWIATTERSPTEVAVHARNAPSRTEHRGSTSNGRRALGHAGRSNASVSGAVATCRAKCRSKGPMVAWIGTTERSPTEVAVHERDARPSCVEHGGSTSNGRRALGHAGYSNASVSGAGGTCRAERRSRGRVLAWIVTSERSPTEVAVHERDASPLCVEHGDITSNGRRALWHAGYSDASVSGAGGTCRPRLDHVSRQA